MNKTQAAKNWLKAMGRFYNWQALAPVIAEASRVARERGATRLGKIHLEIALHNLAEEESARVCASRT